MPKMKLHKGLSKRVKVTAKGKVKYAKPGKNHINSHMSGSEIRTKRTKNIAKSGDIKRLQKMLNVRLTPAD